MPPKTQKRTLLNGLNPLAYEGVQPSSPTAYVTDVRDPISGTTQDYQGFDVGDEVIVLKKADNSVIKVIGHTVGYRPVFLFQERDSRTVRDAFSVERDYRLIMPRYERPLDSWMPYVGYYAGRHAKFVGLPPVCQGCTDNRSTWIHLNRTG